MLYYAKIESTMGVFMKLMFFLIVLIGSASLFAQSKAEINQALDQMKASGSIPKEQIEAARKLMMKMDDKDIKAIVEKAKVESKKPEFQEKVKQMMNKK